MCSCAMEIGSNYVLIEEPEEQNEGSYKYRIHFNDVFTHLRHEPNVAQIIQDKIAHNQAKLAKHLADVKSITARLGVSQNLKLSSAPVAESGTALVVMSGQTNIKQYEADLVRAEKEELPALFEAIKKVNYKVAKWMAAEMLPMLAQSKILNGSIGEIKDRILVKKDTSSIRKVKSMSGDRRKSSSS